MSFKISSLIIYLITIIITCLLFGSDIYYSTILVTRCVSFNGVVNEINVSKSYYVRPLHSYTNELIEIDKITIHASDNDKKCYINIKTNKYNSDYSSYFVDQSVFWMYDTKQKKCITITGYIDYIFTIILTSMCSLFIIISVHFIVQKNDK